MSWLSRLKNALHPRPLDEDLTEELADHLARRAATLQTKGVANEEARHQARVRFGNSTRLHEDTRSARLSTALEGTLQDMRYAWRTMRKGPVFSVTAILSLALAIGANTAIYSIVDAAILRPLPVPEPNRLFVLTSTGIADPGTPPEERESFSYPEYARYAEVSKPAARLFLVGSFSRAEVQDTAAGAPIVKVNRAFISGEGFDILGVQPFLGNLFSGEDNRIPPSRTPVVLSYEFWRRRFGGDSSVIGRRFKVEGRVYDIIGVAREGFFGVEPGRFVDVWVPATQYERKALTSVGWSWFRLFGRLAPGVATDQVQARLQPSFHEFQAQRIAGFRTMPAAIRKQFLASTIHARSAATGASGLRSEFSRPLWIVFGVAVAILLIACANVASLLLARSTARAMEMAMRVSLGAARLRLVRQMLTESLLLALASGGLGWLMARVTAPALASLISPASDPAQFILAIDTRVLFFCLGVSTVSAMLFGLVPAWQASGASPILALRASTGQSRRLSLGKVFVSIQVACAFCLVVVGAAFLFSLGNLLRINPGFNPQDVTVLDMITETNKGSDDPVEEARLLSLMSQLRSRVASQPGIQAVSFALWPIFHGASWTQQVILPGKGPSEREEIFYRISSGYFDTLRTPILAGRDFYPADVRVVGPAPAIVNEAFVRRYLNGRSAPLGQEFSYPSGGNKTVREVIVGVVADAHYSDLRNSVPPIIYLPTEGSSGFALYIRSSLNVASIVRMVGREASAAGPGTRIREIMPLETMVGNTLLRERLLAGIGGTCAFFGIVLAAIGLFGLLTYSVGRRTKEIGIRGALGASRLEIVSLIVKEILAVVGGGLAVGLTAALAVVTFFESLLFDMKGVDPLVIGTAIGLFLTAAVLAAYLPAHRAASIDPMSALREE